MYHTSNQYYKRTLYDLCLIHLFAVYFFVYLWLFFCLFVCLVVFLFFFYHFPLASIHRFVGTYFSLPRRLSQCLPRPLIYTTEQLATLSRKLKRATPWQEFSSFHAILYTSVTVDCTGHVPDTYVLCSFFWSESDSLREIHNQPRQFQGPLSLSVLDLTQQTCQRLTQLAQ